MSWKGALICAVFLLLSLPVRAVDRSNFKTCDQSSFCRCALTRACFSTCGLAPRSAWICHYSNLIRTCLHQPALVYVFLLILYKLEKIETSVWIFYALTGALIATAWELLAPITSPLLTATKWRVSSPSHSINVHLYSVVHSVWGSMGCELQLH